MKGPASILARLPGYRSAERQSLSRPVEIGGVTLYYAIIWLAVLVMLSPILIVIGISFNPTAAESFPPNGFSLQWYGEFFNYGPFFNGFFFISIPIALATGLIGTALGVMTSYVLVRFDVPFKSSVQSIVFAPIVIPSVILGLALLLFFARWDLRWAPANLVAGHTLTVLPYTVLITMTAFYKVDQDLEMAARNLGASKYQAFVKVTLPLMKSGLVASFLLAFVLSFSDINIALFLTSGDSITLPMAMYQFLLYESSPLIAATAVMQILLVFVLIVLVGRLVGFNTLVR